MPYEGDTNTPIVIFITTTPLTGTKPWYLYVFWDSVPIRDNIADVKIADNSYEHRWRFSFLPPITHAYQGSHTVQIWVYDHEGTIAKNTFFYNIVGTVPQLEWWEDLPADFVSSLIGPRGATGPQGAIGSTGLTGPPGSSGLNGVKGDTGAMGPKGDVGQLGETGPQGSIGESGLPGVDGVDGKDAPLWMLYIALFLSGVSTICVILLFGRRK